MADTFDVFLSHNSKDKPAVRELAQALRDQGVRVWLDEDELIPGRPWQEALEEIIQTTRTAAVLVGKDGLGPWENPEMRACLSEFVDRRMPVIPVLLPDAPQKPELPLFLRAFTWVDLRSGMGQDGLDRLVWGITGEKREITPPPPTTGPRLHNLPFLSIGDLLKGRDEDLQRLAVSLQGPSHATAITQGQVIHGLGGIGKTRLAVEYAWRSGDRYAAAFFVVAESPEALRANLAALAGPDLLNLPERQSPAETEIVGAVRRWLREKTGWLMILDNADTEKAEQAVIKILPDLQHGHVVVTSRRTDWPPNFYEWSLDKLSREEASRFLLERTEKRRAKAVDDEERASELAKILDGLPLALEQAAAYIAHRRISFSEYLEDWEKERKAVLGWYQQTMQYPTSLAVTWQKTFDQLGPTARTVLRLCAYLASDPIPVRMLKRGKDIVEDAVALLRLETGEERHFQSVEEALGELASYSMILLEGGSFRVHRMVQEVLRTRIPEDRQRQWIKYALQIVDNAAPGIASDVRNWPAWEILLPHITIVIDSASRVGIPEPTRILMSNLAQHLKAKALYKEAEPLMQRVLRLHEADLGPDHPVVAACLNNLSLLLKATNRLSEAEALMRRALAIDETSLGEDDLRLAIRLNNLAEVLQALNRLSEAEPLVRRALAISEASLGMEHPRVASPTSTVFLGSLRKSAGLAESLVTTPGGPPPRLRAKS